jgi:hypothetical protein
MALVRRHTSRGIGRVAEMLDMRRQLLLGAVGSLSLAACGGSKTGEPQQTKQTGIVLPDITPAVELPQFAPEINEVQIADSFNDVHPSWVIGALVNVKTSKVHSLDGFLKKDANPTVTPQTEVVFKNFIENGVAAQAQWLEFVKAEVSDTTRAEVSVTRASKVTIDSENIDKQQLVRWLTANSIAPRDDYGVIIGYTLYILSAAYFRNTGANASLAGYGAKIGGNWFSKAENSRMHHRIVAVWAPLPFVIENAAKALPENLTVEATNAAKLGKLQVKKLSIGNLRLKL